METKTIVMFVRNILSLSYSYKKYIIIVLLFCVPLIIYSYPSNYLVTIVSAELRKPCKLHKLDPWDATLKHYLLPPPEIKCSPQSSLMFVDQNGYLQFNSSAISQYSLTSLKCVYHMVQRNGDKKLIFDKPVSFEPPFFVPGRQFRVSCKDSSSKTVYDFIHLNVAWNESQAREDAIGPETDEQLSVIYFGLDSASRSHALRKLPLSYKYLTETLGAYDFEGHMKVGLNSFPNLIPLLTGLNSDTFTMESVFHTYLDSVPFIWKDMAKAGYATFHNEDRPDIATMNYVKGGFKTSPVDYYNRPYALAMRDIEPIILNPLGKSTWHCYGNKNHFDLQIDYLKRYIAKYTKRRKFSFLWNNQIGHEDFLSLGRGDQPLLDLLQWMKANGHLERTVLIVGSDHGFRLGGASVTYIGRLENNMPLLTIYLPEVLKSKYKWLHENMVHNTQQLITAYDVHATMKDILNRNFVNSIPESVQTVQTGRSLLNKIPSMRTCEDAGIPPQYCSCYETQSVNISHPSLIQLVAYTMDHLNYMLDTYADVCEKLSFINITEAKVMLSPHGDKDNKPINRNPNFIQRLFGETADDSGRYMILFHTHPNQGLYEVMLDFERHASNGQENKISVIGDPVRVNKYGNQSHCITDATLKQYCFCSDLMQNITNPG